MRVNRRDLLVGGPAAFWGLDSADFLSAEGQTPAQADDDVVDFRVRGMGVPANAVIGVGRSGGK